MTTNDTNWSQIQDTLDKLCCYLKDNNQIPPFSYAEYMDVYSKCYVVITSRGPCNYAEKFYMKHGSTISTYLTLNVDLTGLRGEYLLSDMCRVWRDNRIMDKWLYRFFRYLETSYVKQNELPSLRVVCTDLFNTIVFKRNCREFVAAILEQIRIERDGGVVDRGLLKECVNIFGLMTTSSGPGPDTYSLEFEKPFLESTRAYYAEKSLVWLDNAATSTEYLLNAEKTIATERVFAEQCLEFRTKETLNDTCSEQLLVVHQSALLHKEGSSFDSMLADNKEEDMELVFRLFKDIANGLEPIALIMEKHVVKKGEQLMETHKAASESQKEKGKEGALDSRFILAILDLYGKYSSLIDERFDDHRVFQKALKRAFETLFNKTKAFAELICNFCDKLLKTGSMKMSDEEIESYLEKCAQLLSFITDKDIFGAMYSSQLAKRLLMGRSASKDAEHSMIGKLKAKCGAQFTSKMEGMFKDLSANEDLKKAFKPQSSVNSDNTGIEFSADVLTTGYWPSQWQIDLVVPNTMQKCMDTFSAFYGGRTANRRLKWVHSLGSVVLKASFKRNYDLQVTTLQAVTLMAFNGVSGPMKLQDIVLKLNVVEEVAKRALHSLSCGKYKLLMKEPMSKSVLATDEFRVNAEFSCKLRTFRIPMASLDETHSKKRVEEDRSAAIEAAIVRIMKARKLMSHQQLVSEVLSHLHFFKPSPKDIKRRIGHLIGREYLERDDENANHYKYLA